MGKKSSNNGDKVTLSETYINFQIQFKRKEIQDLQEEINELETKKKKHTETLEQLKKEQENHIKALWRQAKEQQRKLDQREVVSREEVEEALRRNLDTAHSEEAQLTELHGQLSRAERQVSDLESECHTWLQYKDTGSLEYQVQITNLEDELGRMQRDFESAADDIKHTLEETFNEIDKDMAELVYEKKQLAAETAIKHLDKFTKQEIKENEWLQKEIAIYNEEVSSMELFVHSLEEENLQHMNWLFEQRMEDLNLSRTVSLIQAVGPSDSEMQERSHESPTSVAGREMGEATKCLEDDETHSSCSPASQYLTVPLDQSQSQLKDELHLGALEQKLLILVGQAVLLHTLPSEDDDDDDDDDAWDSRLPEDRGPLTTRIINNKFQ